MKENLRPRGILALKGKDDVLSNIAEVSDSYQSYANSNKTANQFHGESKKQKRLELPIMRIGEKQASAEEERIDGKEMDTGRGSLENWLSISSKPRDFLEL